MQQNWLNNISGNTLILTPNSRLARFLLREWQQNNQQALVNSPQILSLQTWLYKYYQNTLLEQDSPLSLLNNHQENYIWQNIIKQSPIAENLLQITSTAETVQQAYQTLTHWNLNLEILSMETHPAVNAFYHWGKQFEQYCVEHDLLSQAHLATYILKTAKLTFDSLPEKIILFNFDEITPQTQQFFEKLKIMSIKIEKIEHKLEHKSCQYISTINLEQELLTMARWAKQQYQQDSSKTITCIVPNLTQIRPLLTKTFRQVFFPEMVFNPNVKQEIFNISGGYSLADAPIIYAALKILQIALDDIQIDHLTFLLTTPFLGNFFEEFNQRACLDSKLRDYNECTLSWDFILNMAKNKSKLSKNIQQYLTRRKQLSKTQTLIQWKNDFHQLLLDIGWPGTQTLNSTEYQQVNRWYNLLQALPTIPQVEQQFSYTQALQLLQHLTKNTLFEIESHDGPIQVLGTLEAAGIVSDAIWIMHLDDKTWPQAANANPYLPYYLQKEQQMPHSSAERELSFAKDKMQRFLNSANEIILSYHSHDDDRPLSVSPLLNNFTQMSPQQLSLPTYNTLDELLLGDNCCEYIDDQQAPPLHKNKKVRGGTSIFKDQANCPFQAFTKHRLQAKNLIFPKNGLDKNERGEIVHLCLKFAWEKLKDQNTLLKQTEQQLLTVINYAIDEAFNHYKLSLLKKLKPKFKMLERTCLQTLLLRWLEFEKKRPAFNVIAREQSYSTTINQLSINTRVDRIDQLYTGEKIIIDYKTGKSISTTDLTEKLREPQLPFYAISEKNVQGISFAQVHINNIKFVGISETDTNIPGITAIKNDRNNDIPNAWQALLDQWKNDINHLTNEFCSGYAKVTPHFHNSCEHCDLHSLCRIAEKEST